MAMASWGRASYRTLFLFQYKIRLKILAGPSWAMPSLCNKLANQLHVICHKYPIEPMHMSQSSTLPSLQLLSLSSIQQSQSTSAIREKSMWKNSQLTNVKYFTAHQLSTTVSRHGHMKIILVIAFMSLLYQLIPVIILSVIQLYHPIIF